MITRTFEPIRSIYAPDNGSHFYQPVILSTEKRIQYGLTDWPSRSYWLVPGTMS